MNTSTEKLPQLLRERKECLEKLLYASERQKELVTRGDLDTIVGHLGHKQRLMDELMRAERALDEYRGVDPAARQWKSEEDRLACEKIIAESESLLQQILSFDQKSIDDMQQQHHDLEQQIKRLGSGVVVATAYSKQNGISQNSTPDEMTTLDLMN